MDPPLGGGDEGALGTADAWDGPESEGGALDGAGGPPHAVTAKAVTKMKTDARDIGRSRR
jgi:hypothetical protein